MNHIRKAGYWIQQGWDTRAAAVGTSDMSDVPMRRARTDASVSEAPLTANDIETRRTPREITIDCLEEPP